MHRDTNSSSSTALDGKTCKTFMRYIMFQIQHILIGHFVFSCILLILLFAIDTSSESTNKPIQKKHTDKKINKSQVKVANDVSYIYCGDDIQNCPPPKPPAVCKCNVQKSFFTMFNGSH